MIVDRATLVELVATAIGRSAANRPRKEGTVMRFRRYAEAAIDAMASHDQGADRATLERVERLRAWIERDRREPDKVLAYAQEMAGLLRGLLAEHPSEAIGPLVEAYDHLIHERRDYAIVCIEHALVALGVDPAGREIGSNRPGLLAEGEDPHCPQCGRALSGDGPCPTPGCLTFPRVAEGEESREP